MEVTDIPNAMDNMGWKVAPQMMRRWLKAGKYKMSKERRSGEDSTLLYTPLEYDDQIITMDWVLKFSRV